MCSPSNEEDARPSHAARSPSPGGRGRSSGVTCPCIFYAEWIARWLQLARSWESQSSARVLRQSLMGEGWDRQSLPLGGRYRRADEGSRERSFLRFMTCAEVP